MSISLITPKLLPNNTDLFVSHDTWGPFETMLKIMKHYKFYFHLNNIGEYILFYFQIQLLPNNSDLFTSHVTWTEYESMLRILKHYKVHFHLNDLGKTC